MRVVNVDASGAAIVLSAHELRMFNNALDETLEALDAAEHSTRVGAERSELTALLDEVHALVKRLPDPGREAIPGHVGVTVVPSRAGKPKPDGPQLVHRFSSARPFSWSQEGPTVKPCSSPS